MFPKLLQVAPTEKALTAELGFSDQVSYFVTKSAGIGEMVFGILLIVFYRNKHIHQLNIVVLLSLCAFVAFAMPQLLVEAFNPVTTNFALIGLSCALLAQAKNSDE